MFCFVKLVLHDVCFSFYHDKRLSFTVAVQSLFIGGVGQLVFNIACILSDLHSDYSVPKAGV